MAWENSKVEHQRLQLITAYMKKYIGNGYYFIESLEDEYENEALEESANLRAIKKIYGSVMKYYIFVKKR